jgi:nitroreductase
MKYMHELFKKRRSIRSFIDKPVEKEKLEEILATANSAPSAGDLKAREIIVITASELRKKISEAAYGQKQVIEAPILLIFVALPEKSAKKYADRGRDLYATQDATLAAGFAWLEAVELGLSCSWVGGFDEKEVQKILILSENQKPIAILPIGYAK